MDFSCYAVPDKSALPPPKSTALSPQASKDATELFDFLQFDYGFIGKQCEDMLRALADRYDFSLTEALDRMRQNWNRYGFLSACKVVKGYVCRISRGEIKKLKPLDLNGDLTDDEATQLPAAPPNTPTASGSKRKGFPDEFTALPELSGDEERDVSTRYSNAPWPCIFCGEADHDYICWSEQQWLSGTIVSVGQHSDQQ